MLNKIYLIALVVFIFGMSFLTYLAYDWLSSVSNPEMVIKEIDSYLSYGRIYLLITSGLLLALANIILWKTRKSWAFWLTFLYFAFFILLQSFWLDGAFMQYKNTKGFVESTVSISPIVGVLLVIAAAAFVYFNQFLVKRMIDKMFAKESEIQELPDEIIEPTDEKVAE